MPRGKLFKAQLCSREVELFPCQPISWPHLAEGERPCSGTPDSALPVWFPGEDTGCCQETTRWRGASPGFRVREPGLYSRSATAIIGSSSNTRTVMKIMVLYGRENRKKFRVEKRSREREREPDNSLSPTRSAPDDSWCFVIWLIF